MEGKMVLTVEQIKQIYQLKILELYQGEEVVNKGKCSVWARRKEIKNEKDLVYVSIHLSYQGEKVRNIIYTDFHLEDSDGYFNKAMPPEDYLEKKVSKGEQAEGGLLFALYKDIRPCRLWFDTAICYENSKDPILMDIALPLFDVPTRSQLFSQEELAQHYTKEMAINLQNVKIKPRYETEKLIRELSAECEIPYKKVSNGYLLKVVLSEGRKQNVIVTFIGKDAKGNDLVTIGTICCPVGGSKHDHIFLKINPKMACGAIGISTIRGQEYYVITDTLSAAIVTKDAMLYAIQNIAAKGDWLESKLTGGKDIE